MRELPKIVKDAQRLRAMVEEACIRMHRRHKYRSGHNLSVSAKAVVFTSLMVWREKGNKLVQLEQLCREVDVLKLDLQLAKDVNAFRSWNEFEAIVCLVDEVGRQSGGWLKRLTPKGQNAQAGSPPAQRAPILSSRPTPFAGVTP